MINQRIVPIIIIALSIFWKNSLGQISVSNLMEYQFGNLPATNPDNLSTLYDQLKVEYQTNQFRVGLRPELFRSRGKEQSYEQLAQRYLEWDNDRIRVRIGNYFTTLGRGLLLRGFELPNVIYEQRQFRKRYAYYRDLDGVLAEGTWQHFEFIALYGEPLDNTFPPRIEQIDYRHTTVQGGQVVVRPFNWLMAGQAYIHFKSEQRPTQDLSSFFGQLSLGKLLQKIYGTDATFNLYAEHARSNANGSDFFSTQAKHPHATYAALNHSQSWIGFSAEYKDYRDFENDINLPPVLYKEHGYYLLNRSTHELITDNETGSQLELTLRPMDQVILTGNASQAENKYSFRTFAFAEKFIELAGYWSEALSSKIFYDAAKDEVKAEAARRTGGVNLEWQLTPTLAWAFDLQQQEIERRYAPGQKELARNTFAAITLSGSPTFSLAYALERSTDLAATDDPATPLIAETKPKYWHSVVGTLELGRRNQVSLFVGTRRGGISCLSGTCYEVLPFEGAELRWISRL